MISFGKRVGSVVLFAIAVSPAGALPGCTGSTPPAEPGGSSPGGAAAPWMTEESPFPDPQAAPAAATGGAPADTAGQAGQAGQAADGGVAASGADIGLLLPDYMEIKRLPRATPDNPEVPRQPPAGDGPVARVNGEEIPRAAYNQRVQRTLDAFFGLTRSMPRSIWKQVVGSSALQLVRRAIDGQKARELGVTVSPEKMDQEFRRFVDDRGGPANWPRFLAHMHVTEEDVKEDVQAKVLHDALLEKGLGDLTISDAAIEEHYRENKQHYFQPFTRHLRQIFVSTGEDYDAKLKLVALQKAEKCLRLLKEENKDFAEVAKKHSEGGTASKGGELGWLHPGQMPKEFEQVAFSMPVGSISDIVRTSMGFHIIQCLEEKAAHQRKLDDELKGEIRKKLQSRLYQQRLSELYRAWYDEAKVEYLDPVIEAEARAVNEQGSRFRVR